MRAHLYQRDDEVGSNDPKLSTYMLYNAELTGEGLKKLGISGIRPEGVHQLDFTDHMEELKQVGQAVAKQVKTEHFKEFVRSGHMPEILIQAVV